MKINMFIANILIHIAVMSSFLTIFFFTIAANQEKNILEEQINFILNSLVGNTLKPFSDTQKDTIKNNLNDTMNKARDNLKSADEKVKKQNNTIIKKAFKFLGILVGIIAVIIIFMGIYFKWNKDNWMFLLISATMGLFFVAAIETLFLFLIAKGYYSVDPRKIKKKIVDKFLDNEKTLPNECN